MVLGPTKTGCGKIWVEDYLGRLGKKIEDFKIEKTRDSFKFGERVYKSLGKIRMPVHLKDLEGRFRSEEVEVHMIEKKVEMLIGNNTSTKWQIQLTPFKNSFNFSDDKEREYAGRRTQGGHIAVELWPTPNEIESNYIELRVEEDAKQDTLEVNYVEDKVDEGFSLEYEDKRPDWIKEKVEEFKFDTRKDKISEIK